MRKLCVLVGAVGLNLALMAPALAGSGSGPGSDVPNKPPVLGNIVTPPDATAFTGADVTVWMALMVAMVVVGVALLLAGWRRRATAAE
ncbi:MAG: hypothetical protein ACXWWX_06875 [Actinomycetota bacterium]